MKFAKGVSGNPGGRPKALVDVITLARLHTTDSIAALARIQCDTKAPPAAQVAAAVALLERGWGKPVQPMEHTGGSGGAIEVIRRVIVDPRE